MAENPRIEELRRRVQADPASIAFAALAEEFRRVGRNEDAIETCRTGLQRHPAYLSARVTLGRALIETGDYDGAREEFETVLRSAPENLAAIRGLAQIHERLGHSTEMDPHLADMMRTMHAESIRVAVAPPPPPEPVVPAAILAPQVDPEPQFEPQPQYEPEPHFAAEPEFPPEPHLPQPGFEPHLQLQPEAPFEVEPHFQMAPQFDPPPQAEAEPRFELEPHPAAQPEVEANPWGQLPPRTEPEFDLSLASPLGVSPAPDPDLAMMLEPETEPEPELVASFGPDPEMLATLARLERLLGAIQSLRA